MNSLEESLGTFRDAVTDCVKSNKSIQVTTHMDCDGIVSGAIMAKALMRAGARFTVGTAKGMSVPDLRKSKKDLCIVADLGAGFADQLDGALGGDWLVLDHHRIPDGERDHPRVINAWKYGMDGGTQICSGGMAYLAAAGLDERNEDLSALAVVSALGDRQDRGAKRSLLGRNGEIARKAQDLELMQVETDLLLVGRETRPLADALASTSQPFIDGLTWNKSMCYKLLNSAGVKLKEGGRWRVTSDLTDGERRSVVDAIAKFAAGGDSADALEDLVGCTYVLPREGRGSRLRDCREFSTMLNSCGRMGRAGAGMAICMGDRHAAPADGEKVLAGYRKMLRDNMSRLNSERWRISEHDSYVMVNAEGVVPEAMTGTVCSLLAGSPRYSSKVVVLRAEEEGGGIKFSSRKSPLCGVGVDLNGLMREGAAEVDGMGGGHDAAAGATIPKGKLGRFLDILEGRLAKL